MNMLKNNILIGNIKTAEDLKDVHYSWALKENWTPSRDSHYAIFNLDNNGFFYLKRNGVIIGTLSAILDTSNNSVFLGFYIVMKEYRGMGYGSILWDFIINKYKKKGLNIILCCHNLNLDMYIKKRFNKFTSGHTFYIESRDKEVPYNFKNKIIDKIIMEKICNYDKKISGYDRSKFLIPWISRSSACTFYEEDIDGIIIGYIVVSEQLNNNSIDLKRIGPLYANSARIAQILIERCMDFVSGKITIDVPHYRQEGLDLCEKFKFSRGNELNYLSLYRSSIDFSDEVFGVTSLAYGLQ